MEVGTTSVVFISRSSLIGVVPFFHTALVGNPPLHILAVGEYNGLPTMLKNYSIKLNPDVVDALLTQRGLPTAAALVKQLIDEAQNAALKQSLACTSCEELRAQLKAANDERDAARLETALVRKAITVGRKAGVVTKEAPTSTDVRELFPGTNDEWLEAVLEAMGYTVRRCRLDRPMSYADHAAVKQKMAAVKKR
jgi:hypothetical protein